MSDEVKIEEQQSTQSPVENQPQPEEQKPTEPNTSAEPTAPPAPPVVAPNPANVIQRVDVVRAIIGALGEIRMIAEKEINNPALRDIIRAWLPTIDKFAGTL